MQILHILPFDITDQSLITFVSEFSILYVLGLSVKAGPDDQRLMMTVFCAPCRSDMSFFVTILGNNTYAGPVPSAVIFQAGQHDAT